MSAYRRPQGDRVRLVPPDRSLHLENALVWMNDPEITADHRVEPGGEPAARKRRSSIGSKARATLTWSGRSSTRTEQHIGFIGLHGSSGVIVGRSAGC